MNAYKMDNYLSTVNIQVHLICFRYYEGLDVGLLISFFRVGGGEVLTNTDGSVHGINDSFIDATIDGGKYAGNPKCFYWWY
jgi:hypothetical protein